MRPGREASVSLRFRTLLPLRSPYRLTIDGTSPGGVRDASGQLIAGDGLPGTDHVRDFGPETLAGAGPNASRPRPAAASAPRVTRLDPAAVDTLLSLLQARRHAVKKLAPGSPRPR